MNDDMVLKFAIQMRDEASAIIQQFGQNTAGAGQNLDKFSKSAKEASASVKELVEAAKGAAAALAGIWTANEMLRGAVDAYEEANKAINTIAYNADMSREAVRGLHEEMADLSLKNGNATIQEMDKLAVIAAKMGARGEDIVKFADALSKITNHENLEQVATGVSKILTATGQGVADVDHFTDALAKMGQGSREGMEGLLQVGGRLAQMTQGMDISGEKMLAYAKTFDQMGGMGQRAAMQFGMTLTMMEQKASQGGHALEGLAQRVGMTASQMQDFAQQHPEEAFEKVLQVISAMKAQGNDPTAFLKDIGISGSRQVHTIEALAANFSKLQANIEGADNAAGAADQFKAMMKDADPLGEAINRLTTAWTEFKTAIGRDSVDVLAHAFNALAETITFLTNAFMQLDHATRGIIEMLVIGLPALIAFGGAIKLLGLALSAASGTFAMMGLAGEGAIMGIKGKMLGLIPVLGEALVITEALVNAFEGGKTILKQQGQMGKQGITWGDEAAAVSSWFTGDTSDVQRRLQAHRDAARGNPAAMAYQPDVGPDSEGRRQQARTGIEDHLKDAAAKAAATGGASGGALSQRQITEAVDQLDEYGKKWDDLTDKIEKFNKARGQMTPAQRDENKQAIERATQHYQAMQRDADPAKAEAHTAALAVAKAQALTKEAQNRLEIDEKIAKLQEEGKLAKSDTAGENGIRTADQGKNAADTAKALYDQVRSAQQALNISSALTPIEKERAEVENTISNFVEKQGGKYADVMKTLGPLLLAEKERARITADLSSAMSQGDAIRKLEDQKKELEGMGLAADVTARAMNKLTRESEAARSPIEAMATANEHNIEQLSKTGHYREADIAALKQKDELEKQGITVDNERLALLTKYQEKLQDVNDSINKGLGGWANQNTDIQKAMEGLSTSFADNMSSAIVNALSGDRNAFQEAGKAFGKAMLDTGIKMAMGGVMKAFGIGDASSEQVSALKELNATIKQWGVQQAAQAKADADKIKSGISQMTVTATNVYVNGSVTGVGATGGTGGAQTGVGAAGGAPSPWSQGTVLGADQPAWAQTALGLTPAAVAAAKAKPGVSISSVVGPVPAGAITSNADGSITWPASTPPSTVVQHAATVAKAAGFSTPGYTAPSGSYGSQFTPGSFATVPPDMAAAHAAVKAMAAPSANIPNVNAADSASRFLGMRADNSGQASTLQQLMNGTNPQTTAWCAAFANANLAAAGIKGSGGLTVHSFDNWGTNVSAANAQRGDVMQLANESHVGLYTGQSRMGPNGMQYNMISGNAGERGEAPNPNPGRSQWGGVEQNAWYNADQINFKHGTSGTTTPTNVNIAQVAGTDLSAASSAHTSVQAALAAAPQAPSYAAPSTGVTMPTGGLFSTSGVGSQLGSGLGGLGNQALSDAILTANPNAGPTMKFLAPVTNAIMQPLQQGLTAAFSGLGSLFSFVHGGGLVGRDSSFSRALNPAIFVGAPRFHDGLGNDEFPAVLQRGERVLTANQDARATSAMNRMADAMSHQSSAAGSIAAPTSTTHNNSASVTVNTPNAGSFRSSSSQIAAMQHAVMTRMHSKNN